MKKWITFILFGFTSFLLHAQPLPAKEVFQIQVNKVDPNTFSINWQIKPGYFLYSDRIKVTAAEDSNVHIAPLRLPPTVTKTDKQGHTYEVYRNTLALHVSVLGDVAGESLVTVYYQGCSDGGFCYPPEQKQIKLGINEQLAVAEVALETQNEASVATQPNEHNQIANIFVSHNWLMILLIFYGFGLLLAFTPCILPMVPVLSGIIVGHGKDITTTKAFFLSLSYVLSMSITYAIAGAVVALVGANLQISMQSPWAIGIFSLIFVLLALSMFGFYEFKLPQSWQTKIAGPGSGQRGGHYFGAAIMGCLSTLILSPCVTGPLIGVLSYIAQTGNVVLGSLTLFVLSLGMGTPLLLIGTSAGKWLPGSGAWMNAVKAFFGVMLLAVAIYLLGRILPASITMVAWACLLIFSGIYAGALTHAQSNQEKFYQGIGIILLGYGLLILIGSSSGSTNPLQPLANLQAASAPSSARLQSNVVKTESELDKALQLAHGRPVLLDFYADWCASCKVMEVSTFKDPAVLADLERFLVIKVDVTDNTPEVRKLMSRFNVVAPPTYIFFNEKGVELPVLTVVGESSASEFLGVLKQV